MICMNKKKKRSLYIIFLLIVFIITFVMCVPQTSSGGGGSSDNDNEISSWNKKFDGSGDSDYAYSVAIDSNNNVYVVGSGNNLVSGSSTQDWWIKKFDGNGNEDTANWDKKFDGNDNLDYAYSVAIDSNNNVYIVGYGYNLVAGSSSYDWWIKKFDGNGNEDTTNWDKKFDGNGGAGARSVTIDSSNNVYVVGYGYNLVTGSSSYDWWIKKFDGNGNEDTSNWDLEFDGNGSLDRSYSVAIDSNNNVYVVGWGNNLIPGSSIQDWWIKKFDSNGNEDTSNWDKKFDGNGSSDASCSVAIDSNNNIYVVGHGSNIVSSSSSYDWWIKKFDSNGNEDTSNWDKKFDGNGGSDFAYSVAIDSNNDIYVVGYGYNLVTGSSSYDWWIKKFDSNGNEDTANWDKKFDGSGGSDYAYSVAIDSNNNVYVVGHGSNLVTGSSLYDWWIKKFLNN